MDRMLLSRHVRIIGFIILLIIVKSQKKNLTPSFAYTNHVPFPILLPCHAGFEIIFN